MNVLLVILFAKRLIQHLWLNTAITGCLVGGFAPSLHYDCVAFVRTGVQNMMLEIVKGTKQALNSQHAYAAAEHHSSDSVPPAQPPHYP